MTRHNAAMLAFAKMDSEATHEYEAGSLYQSMIDGWTDDTTPRTDRPVRFMRADLKYGRQSHTWRWQPFGSTVSAIIPRIA